MDSKVQVLSCPRVLLALYLLCARVAMAPLEASCPVSCTIETTSGSGFQNQLLGILPVSEESEAIRVFANFVSSV